MLKVTNTVSRVTGILFPVLVLAQNVPEFDAQRAFGFLEEQCALGPRNPGSPGHRDGLKYILDVISPLADEVLTQPFPYSDPYSGSMFELTNVVAQFNPELNRRLWVAAHWDTRPWADRDKTKRNRIRPILGANDGASGVAVLLELAHHFHELPPATGVDLIFLDGEDLGKQGDRNHFFNGSRYLAKNIPTQMPDYCILIDMVGDKDLQLPVELNSWRQAPKLVGELWNLAAHLTLTSFEWRVGHAVDDDHVVVFEEGGIPSVDIIDFEYPNRSDNYWHTLEDTPDKCSPESLKTVGTLLLHHIYGKE
ncbi:MAG: M28 family peptidase [Candidatus Neomarinimicrobiota bacterium]